jgi:phage shock protein E
MILAPNTILIDVRSADEFNSGHIEGAISLPLNRIDREIASAVPDKATPVLLDSHCGARSGRACGILTQPGYQTARNGGAFESLSLSPGCRVAQA